MANNPIIVETNAADVAAWLTSKQRDLPRTMREFEKEARRETLRRYRRTTSTWSHKPDFVVQSDISGANVTMLSGTDDRIWKWVDEGTRPHRIVHKVAKFLRFQPGYQAKTKPGVMQAGPGGAFGAVVFRRAVMHPGTQPRRFSASIFRDMTKEMPKIMQRQLEKWRMR